LLKETDGDSLALSDKLTLGDSDTEGLALGLTELLSDNEAERDSDALRLGDSEGLSEALSERDMLGLSLLEGD
jgi:hypothetical protein